MIKPPEWFDSDYYERGIETGKSCYQNYRWVPELTIPMAMTIIDLLGIKRGEIVLDFGCSKGYLVKALRLLHRNAWGCDISEYAIRNVDPAVRDFCYLAKNNKNIQSDVCIAKDVFEHVSYHNILDVITNIKARNLFAVIPLGQNGKYYAEANDFDKSHEICEGESWWINTFDSAGWKVTDYFDRVIGIKDSYEKGTHGFFIASRILL